MNNLSADDFRITANRVQDQALAVRVAKQQQQARAALPMWRIKILEASKRGHTSLERHQPLFFRDYGDEYVHELAKLLGDEFTVIGEGGYAAEGYWVHPKILLSW